MRRCKIGFNRSEKSRLCWTCESFELRVFSLSACCLSHDFCEKLWLLKTLKSHENFGLLETLLSSIKFFFGTLLSWKFNIQPSSSPHTSRSLQFKWRKVPTSGARAEDSFALHWRENLKVQEWEKRSRQRREEDVDVKKEKRNHAGVRSTTDVNAE